MGYVRVHGQLEKKPNSYLGLWRVKCNNGTYTAWTDEETARQYLNHINNEDREGEYFYVPDEPTAQEVASAQAEYEAQRARENEEWQRRQERRKKEQQRVEANRKSKRSDEKYVFVISCIQRGHSGTEYYLGDTNLLAMGNSRFTSAKVEKAKVFKTKASAQKIVDILSSNFLVNRVFRNFKVVRKDKKIFGL